MHGQGASPALPIQEPQQVSGPQARGAQGILALAAQDEVSSSPQAQQQVPTSCQEVEVSSCPKAQQQVPCQEVEVPQEEVQIT
jgi:hypothetical protein